MKEELLKQFSEWISFLSRIENQNWDVSLGEGKWRVHDVISHIYLWDKYFYEEAISPIFSGSPLTLKHIDFDEFNEKAKETGSLLAKEELIKLSIQYRSHIINDINKLDDDTYNREHIDGDGNKFIIEVYLKDFIWHDRHHMKQIEEGRAMI